MAFRGHLLWSAWSGQSVTIYIYLCSALSCWRQMWLYTVFDVQSNKLVWRFPWKHDPYLKFHVCCHLLYSGYAIVLDTIWEHNNCNSSSKGYDLMSALFMSVCTSERWGELSCPGVHLHLLLQRSWSLWFPWPDCMTLHRLVLNSSWLILCLIHV